MSLVDPISDMLTRIRNAYSVSKDSVLISVSKNKLAILEILKEKGYISDFSVEGRNIIVVLQYKNSLPVVKSLERVSKPGRRVYVKTEEIPSVLSGHGIAVLSTSKGIMTGDSAKKEKIGGELICKVY